MVKRTNKPHHRQTRSQLKKRKKLQHTAFQHHLDFQHPTIAQAWNHTHTLKQNYQRLGLICDPNDRRRTKKEIHILTHTHIELDAQPEEVQAIVTEQITKRRKRHRETEEQAADDHDHDDEQQDEESNKISRIEDEDDDDVSLPAVSPAAQALHKELADVCQISSLSASHKYQVKSMSLDEQRRIRALIQKYGDDVKAMSRDISINVNQDTAAVLRKRIALYQRLQAA